jgi:putative Mg2+ transporter-C (MgtC) family protein
VRPWLGDWHGVLGPIEATVALTLVAVFCGALIGSERERQEKPAGFRTMILVSLGAAIFTQLTFVLAGTEGDRSRIAAQIVTGVGFLGAGAILRGPGGVQGLTTAATIWATAAIGTAVGAGYAVAGLAASLVTVTLLAGAKALDGKGTVKIDEILAAYRIERADCSRSARSDGRIELEIPYCDSHKHHREFLTRLADLAEVHEIRRDSLADQIAE